MDYYQVKKYGGFHKLPAIQKKLVVQDSEEIGRFLIWKHISSKSYLCSVKTVSINFLDVYLWRKRIPETSR